MSKIPKALVGGMFEDDPSRHQRDGDIAIDLYLQALKLNPNNARALRNLRAVEIKLASKRPPGFNPEAKNERLFTKAREWMAMNKYDATLEVCEEIFRTDPAHVGGQILSFDAALEGGYRQRAIATLDYIKILQTGKDTPQFSAALCRLASAYEEENKIGNALEIWQLVLKANPSDTAALLKIRALSLKSRPPDERSSE